ncbi:MAG TPA: UDP-N-acetylglucosamine 2-epimerase [Methylomirabilota bacterium]|nr:UDP-N-acetylglucosamine 2-epimerase [Methylomirabilota bacterium]
MRRAIGVVTVARSDYGHLLSLLAALEADSDVELGVFVAGSHLSTRFGWTADLVEADGWPIAARIDMGIDDDAPAAIATATGRGVTGFAEVFARHRPDLLVVLGDRYEMLAAALAALPFALPVAHLHGGEVTEGAIDEQIRHAITKLAHLHFVAAEAYAARVRQLGEEPWRVHCCGAPGLDRLQARAALSREALGARLGGPLGRPTLLVTFHPETLAAGDVPRQAEELTAALEKVDGNIVATAPGADTAHGAITAALERLAARRPATRVVTTLGDEVYCSLLREADVMVGNSSSGLIEAPTFGLPVVNVGDRQRGRLRATNVLDVPAEREAIAEAIGRALEPGFRRGLAGLVNPYGDGNAAPRIARVLREVELGPRLTRKRFVDRPA